ncbi:MAG: hypothetical protein WA055_04685 [Candidatus Moraniibacteriota bacterium]
MSTESVAIQKFSKYFNLSKSQFELDFVDVSVNNGDVPLFIDPYAISKRMDFWSVDCHNLVVSFFQNVVDKIKQGDEAGAKYALSELGEPNQTRFGLSRGDDPHGRGVGGEQSEDLYKALSDSTAIKTGLIQDLEECELMIEGIGRDKISDITTNIIRHKLIEYTQFQCELWNIRMESTPSGFVWDDVNKKWTNDYVLLPVCNRRSVLLVPKAIARFDIEFNHQEYYQHFVLNFLQSEHLNANSSLVRTLRDGTKRPPTKKLLKEKNPLSKKFLYEFSKEHSEVLREYRGSKGSFIRELTNEDLLSISSEKNKETALDYKSLSEKLDSISAGGEFAADFHNHITGALTAIFYPFLMSPKKEQEIHDGRKRIDIVFQNAAHNGFFFELPNNKSVPSGYIFVECKNYSGDPKNPELDQLAGRFSVNRGRFGFLVCRSFVDKNLFIKRCKDTAQDGRGFILALDDNDIKNLLTLKSKNNLRGINDFLESRYKELVM